MGLSDLGDALSWGEARTLLEDAAGDGSTAFGAELAGWAYPASMLELLHLVAAIGDKKASARLLPWAMENPRRKNSSQATPDEIAIAEQQLESEFVFT